MNISIENNNKNYNINNNNWKMTIMVRIQKLWFYGNEKAKPQQYFECELSTMAQFQ